MSLEKDIPQELKSKILSKLRDELVATGYIPKVRYTRPEGWDIANLLVLRWRISILHNNFHLLNIHNYSQKVVGIDENSTEKIISILGAI
jgi:hypothetical protein